MHSLTLAVTNPVPSQLTKLLPSYLSTCTEPLPSPDPIGTHAHLEGSHRRPKALRAREKLRPSSASEPRSTEHEHSFAGSVDGFPLHRLLNAFRHFSPGNSPGVGAFHFKHSFSFHICLSSKVRNTRGSPGHRQKLLSKTNSICGRAGGQAEPPSATALPGDTSPPDASPRQPGESPCGVSCCISSARRDPSPAANAPAWHRFHSQFLLPFHLRTAIIAQEISAPPRWARCHPGDGFRCLHPQLQRCSLRVLHLQPNWSRTAPESPPPASRTLPG